MENFMENFILYITTFGIICFMLFGLYNFVTMVMDERREFYQKSSENLLKDIRISCKQYKSLITKDNSKEHHMNRCNGCGSILNNTICNYCGNQYYK